MKEMEWGLAAIGAYRYQDVNKHMVFHVLVEVSVCVSIKVGISSEHNFEINTA
jgi:hypothetical protein